MDFKTETQLRQELTEVWNLVEDYKRVLALANARIRELETRIREHSPLADPFAEDFALTRARIDAFSGALETYLAQFPTPEQQKITLDSGNTTE